MNEIECPKCHKVIDRYQPLCAYCGLIRPADKKDEVDISDDKPPPS